MRYLARLRIPLAQQQVNDRGLAGAAGPDQGDVPARRDIQGQTVEDLLFPTPVRVVRVVFETHVVEMDGRLDLAECRCAAVSATAGGWSIMRTGAGRQ